MRKTLILALAVACGCGKKPGHDAPTGPAREMGDPGDAIDVTAAKLWLDYRDDPAGADAKYLGKTLRVTGRVLGVEPAPGGDAVGIETGPNVAPDGRVLRPAVVIECGPSGRVAVGRLNDADEVTAVGRCEGHIDAPGRVGGIKVTLAGARIVFHTPRAK